MALSDKYPFSMIWTGYPDHELIREAHGVLAGCDRDDVVELAKELARRFEEVLVKTNEYYHENDTSRRRRKSGI